MRIPLDYYRILGLPLAASDEQLRQAYSDRIVQLPRREYSQAAISSRKQLIEEAYVVLSNPKERRSYDQLYLAHAYDPDGTSTAKVAVGNAAHGHGDPDSQSLSIEISPEELAGALLILQELGEYELVLKLGRMHLANHHGKTSAKISRNFTTEEFLESAEHPADIVLTVALACLELGREQWQQGHYESAALSLETGQEMLASEGLFPNVQAEIQADLYKLRPYRILELLALPTDKTAQRRQGLDLLQSILDDRGGIDGNGNDESGLNIDDFLRFIQQLRIHLTVVEQHKLFEAESQRPSAVATYLAVYASIARGFSQRQPALIRQAKQMLMRLGKRQDVHLEQSLCALLLGQTEESTRVLELSQEYEALAFIREKSQNSPDLLPGLCFYTEQWLQHEVFPHFRDLAKQRASLKDYFANEQVQAYLEALPTEAETTNDWAVINRQPFSQPPANIPRSTGNSSGTYSQFQQNTTPNSDLQETPIQNPDYSYSSGNTAPTPPQAGRSTYPETPSPQGANIQQRPHLNQNTAKTSPPNQRPRRRRRKPSPGVSPERVAVTRQRRPQKRRTFASRFDKKTRLLLTVFGSFLGILVFWLIVSTTVSWVKNMFFPAPTLQGERLFVQLNEPPIQIPDSNSKLRSPEGPLTDETAQEVIETWLSTKAAALGPDHEIDSLEDILAGSALSQWRLIAQQELADNRYRKYEHDVKVENVKKNDKNSDRAIVEATVKEATQYYENGQKKDSAEENLRVRYDVIRQAGEWRIQSMSVVSQS